MSVGCNHGICCITCNTTLISQKGFPHKSHCLNTIISHIHGYFSAVLPLQYTKLDLLTKEGTEEQYNISCNDKATIEGYWSNKQAKTSRHFGPKCKGKRYFSSQHHTKRYYSFKQQRKQGDYQRFIWGRKEPPGTNVISLNKHILNLPSHSTLMKCPILRCPIQQCSECWDCCGPKKAAAVS